MNRYDYSKQTPCMRPTLAEGTRGIRHYHISNLRLAAMFAHVMCMHCVRDLATRWRAVKAVKPAQSALAVRARAVHDSVFDAVPVEPALRGVPRSIRRDRGKG